MRVLIAEDSVLLRQGLVHLLTDAGFDVVAAVDDADQLLRAVDEHRPDICVVDVRMPPTHTDEGVRAALVIRAQYSDVAVLMLSQYVEERYATDLIASDTRGFGYLLKDRVADVTEFVEAVRRVGAGGTALDPEVVAQLLVRSRRADPLAGLTPARDRGARTDGRRPLQRRHRLGAGRQRGRRREARELDLHQVRPAACRAGPSTSAGRAALAERLRSQR